MLPNIYFVDMGIIYKIFLNNIWYLAKLLIVAYFFFYWIPTKIFPQEHTGRGIQKVVFNLVYMVSYVEVVVTFLVFIKAFSIVLFLFTLVATKLLFLKYYYKKNISILVENIKNSVLYGLFTLMDKTEKVKERGIRHFGNKIANYVKSITFYTAFQKILFFSIFTYIITVLMYRGLYSYGNPIPDTAQFIEWVNNLQNNILYSDARISADFYGQAIMDFFVNTFTNIDTIILFSLYPILLLMALYFSIYYVVKDFTKSKYVAIFAVMVHGIILMSPLSNYFLGKIVTTTKLPIVDFYGFSIYLPASKELLKSGIHNGYVTYLRYISGLAYEHASVFVLLNAYFLIKTLTTHLNKYLLLYGLTLMLVFVFHGGGAIVLIIISIFIAINAALFGKINISILKKGLSTVLIASILGNLWILSMLKYGIPQDFGVAAPFLDKFFHTAVSMQHIVKVGFQAITITVLNKIHFILFAMIIFAYIFAFFTKRKFLTTSYMLIIIGIFIPYFGPNAGLPMLANQSRLGEYLFFGITLLFSFYFFYFIYKPILLIFKKYAKYILLLLFYAIFIFSALSIPKWMDTKLFWKNINSIEYTAIPDIILKINKQNRPFTWTVISYVQEYGKVRNKGYHINTQKFLLRYNPQDKTLKIATPKIYIFVENFPNPYKGKDEWYYRWRGDIQNDLKSWIAIYSANHSNIRVYYKTKNITVYEIDNSKYVEHLKKLAREKRMKNDHF